MLFRMATIKQQQTLTSVAQMDGHHPRKAKNRWFDSWSGHMPRLRVQFPVGACRRDNPSMFFYHIEVSLPALSPLPLPSKNKSIKKFKTNKNNKNYILC